MCVHRYVRMLDSLSSVVDTKRWWRTHFYCKFFAHLLNVVLMDWNFECAPTFSHSWNWNERGKGKRKGFCHKSKTKHRQLNWTINNTNTTTQQQQHPFFYLLSSRTLICIASHSRSFNNYRNLPRHYQAPHQQERNYCFQNAANIYYYTYTYT